MWNTVLLKKKKILQIEEEEIPQTLYWPDCKLILIPRFVVNLAASNLVLGLLLTPLSLAESTFNLIQPSPGERHKNLEPDIVVKDFCIDLI